MGNFKKSIDETRKQEVSVVNYWQNSKLLVYPEKLRAFLETGKTDVPTMVDMDLTNACNHRCPGCVGSKNSVIEAIPVMAHGGEVGNAKVSFEDAKDRIKQFAEAGVKSMIFGGGGDPTMHPNLAELIRFVKLNGMEIAINTNGMFLKDEVIEAIVDCCTWTRISIDADGPEIYKKTHGIGEIAWNKTMTNIKRLTQRKKEKGSDVIIGVTYLLDPKTKEGVYNAAKVAKGLDVNYIRFRPFFNWGDEKWTEEDAMFIISELKRAEELNDNNFLVSFATDRVMSMANEPAKRKHGKCYIHHFETSISPDGKMAPCCLMKNNPRYVLGDLNKKSFKEIWNSDERKEAYDKIDFSHCPTPCMQEGNNEVLWELKHLVVDRSFLDDEPPNPEHKNFL